jgi:hypothetical protein
MTGTCANLARILRAASSVDSALAKNTSVSMPGSSKTHENIQYVPFPACLVNQSVALFCGSERAVPLSGGHTDHEHDSQGDERANGKPYRVRVRSRVDGAAVLAHRQPGTWQARAGVGSAAAVEANMQAAHAGRNANTGLAQVQPDAGQDANSALKSDGHVFSVYRAALDGGPDCFRGALIRNAKVTQGHFPDSFASYSFGGFPFRTYQVILVADIQDVHGNSGTLRIF